MSRNNFIEVTTIRDEHLIINLTQVLTVHDGESYREINMIGGPKLRVKENYLDLCRALGVSR